VTRKPIISGGHLLTRTTVKKESNEDEDGITTEEKMKPISNPDGIVDEWTREEEKMLCELYLKNSEADEAICDRLKEIYGPSIKWRDF
jgi:hypothetical protein